MWPFEPRVAASGPRSEHFAFPDPLCARHPPRAASSCLWIVLPSLKVPPAEVDFSWMPVGFY
eukprot:14403221-Alexandrium_andersonii.AAC.1